ncbi:MAG TPA: hypothetical protein VLQ48_17460, partial [Chloroflexia bacterium]|nr:hypothetical protein [Chloroflexia bacterium]
MNKRTWLLIAIAALATLAMSSVAGLGLLTSSAAAPVTGSIAQAATEQNTLTTNQPGSDDPFDVRSFNCADISTYHIDQQLNPRANAIMANCTGEQIPAAAPDGVSADQISPDAYGGTDQNVHPSNSA